MNHVPYVPVLMLCEFARVFSCVGGGEEAVSSTTGAPVDPEERGDIVKFYNQVYVYQLKEFALKFSPDDSTV